MRLALLVLPLVACAPVPQVAGDRMQDTQTIHNLEATHVWIVRHDVAGHDRILYCDSGWPSGGHPLCVEYPRYAVEGEVPRPTPSASEPAPTQGERGSELPEQEGGDVVTLDARRARQLAAEWRAHEASRGRDIRCDIGDQHLAALLLRVAQEAAAPLEAKLAALVAERSAQENDAAAKRRVAAAEARGRAAERADVAAYLRSSQDVISDRRADAIEDECHVGAAGEKGGG